MHDIDSIIKNSLVIIPARGGSKRIPNKNIKPICNQPMIYWPLMELSKFFSKENVIISTDSKEIVDILNLKGIEVPFVRPRELSDDFTGTIPVAKHALNWFEENRNKVSHVLIIYPTAVLLNINDIKDSLQHIKDNEDLDFVMSATSFPAPIQRALYLDKQGKAKMFNPEHYSSRSQDLRNSYHDAGQFYIYNAESLRNGKTLVDSNVGLKILPRNRVIDIDTEEDFEVAESRMREVGLDKIDFSWTFDN